MFPADIPVVFLKFPYFQRSKGYVVRHLVRQLILSIFGDNNLVLFWLYNTETVLNYKKVLKYSNTHYILSKF